MWGSELFWFLTNYFFIIPKAIIYDHLKTIISISFIALRIALPRLREKLEDKEPGVQAAAVNVICELARKNPKQYLPLSPVLLKLMNKSSNNWVLIKIIKLFGSLIQFEPRLGMCFKLTQGTQTVKIVQKISQTQFKNEKLILKAKNWKNHSKILSIQLLPCHYFMNALIPWSKPNHINPRVKIVILFNYVLTNFEYLLKIMIRIWNILACFQW